MESFHYIKASEYYGTRTIWSHSIFMTFSEKSEGTIMVWLNTRKQNRGFPADRSEMFLLYLRLYDRHVIVLLFFQTVIIDDDW